jgi:lipopolysaccharide export system permease protein
VTVFDRYILREWLKILALILCATVGLLLIQAFYDDFRDLLDLGARTEDIMLYYATSLPGYFSVVLPIALLLSLLFVLSKLHRNNEITAMRSAGLNIFAATRSLWLACAIFCGVSYLLNAHLKPWSTEASRHMMESFKYRDEARKTTPGGTLGLVTGVTFDNYRLGRMWYINRYSRYAQKAYGVTVSELDKDRRERTRLMASEGVFDPVTRSWVFTDGREMWFDVESGELIRSVLFEKKEIPHFNEDPALMLLIDRRPVDLSLFELRRIVGYFEIEANPKVLPYAVRYYGVLADTLGPLIILAIAIPFAMSGVRVSPTVGVSNAIGLFIAYFFLNMLATELGGNGYMDPLWAAWMPNIALIGLATFFFGRMR